MKAVDSVLWKVVLVSAVVGGDKKTVGECSSCLPCLRC